MALSTALDARYVLNDPADGALPFKLGASGTLMTQVRVFTPTLTPVAVATIVAAEQTFTVTGLTTADKVVVNQPA